MNAGNISHNYFNFYEDAVETRLHLGDWDEADRFGQALENYNCDEPLGRCEYVVARGRALTAYGRGHRDEQTIEEILRIYEYGKKFVLTLSLTALEAALSGVKRVSEHMYFAFLDDLLTFCPEAFLFHKINSFVKSKKGE